MPGCNCAERSVVFTCPVCCGLAVEALDALIHEELAQGTLFKDIDRPGSVSALDEDEESLFEKESVEWPSEPERAQDGLPF